MTTLSPAQAAAIAAGVYTLRTDTLESVRLFGDDTLGIQGTFSMDDASRFSGKAGAMMFKTLSGFGFVAAGVGPFAGDVLIATRGTAVMADWMTDLNIGVQRGPGGMPVHAGFNDTWKSFAPVVREFLRGRNPTRIHCVGHSLGGALAKLNADFVTANRIADVRLYTFGAPRTGDGLFAKQLTERVGKANIFRVSNPVDPVPMIPIFPFWHLPFGEQGLQIARTSNMPVSFAAHKMATSYVPGVAGKNWDNMRAEQLTDQQVAGWLERAAEGQGSFIMGSAKLLDMIGRALAWMVKAAGVVVKGTLGVGLAGAFTILDQVAWLLTKAAQISAELGRGLVTLVSLIFRFLGRKAVDGAQITAAFLRWLLESLFSTLRAAAQRALSLLG